MPIAKGMVPGSWSDGSGRKTGQETTGSGHHPSRMPTPPVKSKSDRIKANQPPRPRPKVRISPITRNSPAKAASAIHA
jgi:hypothetical protein